MAAQWVHGLGERKAGSKPESFKRNDHDFHDEEHASAARGA
jgi:hypothetical protein